MTHPERVEDTAEELIRLYTALPPEKKELFWEKEAVRHMQRNTELQAALHASEKRAETARDDALENAARRFDNLETPIEPHLIARTIRAMKGQR